VNSKTLTSKGKVGQKLSRYFGRKIYTLLKENLPVLETIMLLGLSLSIVEIDRSGHTATQHVRLCIFNFKVFFKITSTAKCSPKIYLLNFPGKRKNTILYAFIYSSVLT
jgi:hypothetical protein